MYSLQGFPDEGSDNMKIEKVNENQIRCTLTREDLAERDRKGEDAVSRYDAAGCL